MFFSFQKEEDLENSRTKSYINKYGYLYFKTLFFCVSHYNMHISKINIKYIMVVLLYFFIYKPRPQYERSSKTNSFDQPIYCGIKRYKLTRYKLCIDLQIQQLLPAAATACTSVIAAKNSLCPSSFSLSLLSLKSVKRLNRESVTQTDRQSYF